MAKIKGNFLSSDYASQMFKKLQGLKQKEMDVKSYIEEFYRLSIRAGHMEDEVEKIARYLSELRFNIQDELTLENPRMVEECYQMTRRAEEKLKRRQDKHIRGKRSNNRGRGTFSTPRQSYESQEDTSKSQEQVVDVRGGFRGGRSSFRGRFGGQGRGSQGFTGMCYQCNKFGHQEWQCNEGQASRSHGGERTQLVQEEDNESVNSPSQHVNLEVGE